VKRFRFRIWQDYLLQFFRKRANKAGISIKQSHIACFDGETRATSFDNRKYIKENS